MEKLVGSLGEIVINLGTSNYDGDSIYKIVYSSTATPSFDLIDGKKRLYV
jgi:hypothetical protein